MSALQILIDDNVRLLEQGHALLVELDEELYVGAVPSAGLSGPGSHFRHLLDFYDRFFEGLEPARIDYDLRQRDVDLESDPSIARGRLSEMIQRLEALPTRPRAAALLVKSDAEDAGPSAPWAGSTVERELMVLMSHTVHHYALIAVALRLNGWEMSSEFGVAPSTLRHWKEQRACAR